MNSLPKKLKSLVTYALCVSLTLSGALPTMAAAQSVSCDNFADSDRGVVSRCAAVRVNGQKVSYPRFNWQHVSDVSMSPAESVPGGLGGSAVISLANRSAEALGLNASDVTSMVSTFPANVPYVVGRYNPMDSTLRIDLFKLEKSIEGGRPKAGLYQAQFGPSHGDMWKAARSYLSPSDFRAGLVPGRNPFKEFYGSGDDNFHNISLAAAQVAVGHAMRATGTPFALMAVAQPRISSVQSKSGGWLKKTTKTWVYGHAKPIWYIAQSTSTLSRSESRTFASFCASDPTRTDCPLYETAVSGVAFEQFEGGTLSAEENAWVLDYQEQSGFTFLAMVVLGVFASYAMVGMIGGATASTAAAGAGAGAGTMGSWGGLLTNAGVVSSASSIGGGIAAEALIVSGSLLLGGANLGSTFETNALSALAVAKVSKGVTIAPSLSTYQTKLNVHVAPATTSDMVAGTTLQGVATTVTGGCALGSLARHCVGAASGAGVISRPDELRTENEVEFREENYGRIVRSSEHDWTTDQANSHSVSSNWDTTQTLAGSRSGD